MAIKDLIKSQREKLGLSQSDVARELNVRPQSVQQWESGETLPRGSRLDALARVLKIEQPIGLYNVEEGPTIRRSAPLISWVQAGNWCGVIDNLHTGDAEDWLPCPVKCSPQTYVLRVRGISMEPRFPEGELIFVDPAVEAKHKSFVVVRLADNEEATFKQYIVEGDKRYLKPLNPAWPEQIIPIPPSAIICGVVIFKGEAV